jgi:hypothetical protein
MWNCDSYETSEGVFMQSDQCRINECEQQLKANKAAVQKFFDAQGNDLCHELRHELAHAFGIEPNDCTQGLPPEAEFAVRCVQYRKQLYGPDGPGSEQEAYEALLKEKDAELARLTNALLAEKEAHAALQRLWDSAKAILCDLETSLRH